LEVGVLCFWGRENVLINDTALKEQQNFEGFFGHFGGKKDWIMVLHYKSNRMLEGSCVPLLREERLCK
jgi:hypothetical protein